MTDTLKRIIKHKWKVDPESHTHYICEKCGYRRTFNPNIDYTSGSIPFPLTGYDIMNFNEALYGECV